MDDLVAWIREQLDDDELVARDAGGRNWGREAYGCVVDAADNGLIVYSEGTPSREQADHIARHDPARVLREVEAKRRIAGIHDRYASKWPNALPSTRANCCDGCGYEGDCDDPVTEDVNQCPELRALAAIYSGHPGYRSEWAPR